MNLYHQKFIYNTLHFYVFPFLSRWHKWRLPHYLEVNAEQEKNIAVFFTPDPVSPSRASYSSLFLEYVEMPQETPWGWRRNMWLKHLALSLLYLTVLLLREWLLPQRSNSPLLALPLSPINGYIYASWKRLVALQLLSLFVSWASGVPKLVCRLFKKKKTPLDFQSAMQRGFSSSCYVAVRMVSLTWSHSRIKEPQEASQSAIRTLRETSVIQLFSLTSAIHFKS